jgi:hypothetical protein
MVPDRGQLPELAIHRTQAVMDDRLPVVVADLRVVLHRLGQPGGRLVQPAQLTAR